MPNKKLIDLANNASARRSNLAWAIFIFAALPLLALGFWGGSGHAAGLVQELSATPSPFQPSSTPSPTPTPTSTPTSTPEPSFEAGGRSTLGGSILVSMNEQGYSRLFWHQLSGEPFVRLTRGEWDDIQPAASASGSQLAYTSNQRGQWDLVVLDLLTGESAQLSSDAEYDGNPSWSSDGSWLAYEHDDGGNLEIFIRPVDGSVDPVLISANPSLDYDPAWRPGAQQIAFVSDRDGSPLIWLVDLEASGDERFRPVAPGGAVQDSPAWSPDGAWLAWAEQEGDSWVVYVQDLSDPDPSPQRLGLGANPHWNPAGNAVLTELRYPHKNYLTAYTLDGSLALAPELLPGHLQGSTWGGLALVEPLSDPLAAAARVTPAAEWMEMVVHASSGGEIAPLDGVTAPFAELSDGALVPFNALREHAAQLLGWDALSSLDSAFVPLDYLLPPDRQQDWLYTGRAFEIHSALLEAGWLAVVHEEFEGETYWRVFLRTTDESGGLGRPLTDQPWDFSARSADDGGHLAGAAPGGYWVDFTALAAEYGFERIPALDNWRSYFPGALFNQFVFRGRLSWEEAMLQIYSEDELAGSDSP